MIEFLDRKKKARIGAKRVLRWVKKFDR